MEYAIAIVALVAFALFIRNRIRAARKDRPAGGAGGGSRPKRPTDLL